MKTPEERRRRLEEMPNVHADPKMDPSYESDENGTEDEDSRRGILLTSSNKSSGQLIVLRLMFHIIISNNQSIG